MVNIVFVVLHYETLQDTRECLDSLLKYVSESVEVVLVDNGSIRGKLSEIETEYSENERIHFIYSKENLGFAKGNNIGYKFAKYNLNADIIILCNNDLIFKQGDFIGSLLKKYNDYDFDIAGPKIISLVDNYNHNPVRVLYPNIQTVKKRIFKYYILYILCFFNLDILAKKRVAKSFSEFYPNVHEDFQLHGSCLIFGNRYIRKYDGLYDKTFMYGEESILKYISQRDNMKMIYIDEITVYHKEGSATGNIYGKGRKKRMFYYKWNIFGCKLLKKLMIEK